MKTAAFFGALMIVSATAIAQQCNDLSDYQVQPVSFSRMPVKMAIEKLLSDTSYKAEVIGGGDYKVSANGISGPLSSVLQTLSQSIKFSYETNKCRLIVRFDDVQEEKLKPAQTWQISPGDKISGVFRKWATQSGAVLYWEAPELIAEGAGVADGDFEEAMQKIVGGLNAAGAGLRVVSYEQGTNRYIRIVEKK